MQTPDLDLDSLLQLLVGYKNGVLHLEPPEKAKIKKPWHASLHLAEEGVVTCYVRSKANDRVMFSGTEAINWLKNAGPLSWNLDESFHMARQFTKPSMPVRPPEKQRSLQVPCRMAQVEQSAMFSWSRRQRQVFALVDNRRDAEKIAAILRQPFHDVQQVLDELQSMGVIQQ